MPFRLDREALGHLLREAGKRPPRFLVSRAVDQLLTRVRAWQAALGWNPYRARLRHRELESQTVLGRRRPGDDIAWGLAEWPDRAERLVERAAANARGEFEIFSVRVRGDPRIDWHRDHGSGESWPVRFHADYRYAELIDPDRPTDVKVPWELSRLQCLPRLALAYRSTGEVGYVVAARAILADWDRANPVGHGINWTVGMEVGLRGVSILLADALLRGSEARDEFCDERLVELLGEHGRFLHRNVEYSDVSGNHLTSCLVGLLYLGTGVIHEPEAATWRDVALERLEVEIQRQVYPDGVCHEGSIPYHGLVTELFAHAFMVARRSGSDFDDAYAERLARMLEFLRACLKPGGGVPIWGDTDDGRVFSLGGPLGEHHQAILSLGAALLGRDDLWNAARVPLETNLLLGRDEARRLAAAPPAASPPRHRAFPHGGFFLLREQGDYCLVDCGDVGLRGRGGHGHNDALSVELTIGGRDVLVDTGSSSYSRSIEERVACIGARAHNAVVLDGQEPAPIDASRIPHSTACPVEVESWDAERGSFEGRHRGYENAAGVAYARRVERLAGEPGFRIRDRLAGAGRHQASWHFHLDMNWVEADLLDDRAVFRAADADGTRDDRILEIRWQGSSCAVEVVESPVYPSYGVRRERRCLVVRTAARLPIENEFEFRLLPGRARCRDE